MNYVFDVDGTLSESRQTIQLDFRLWFLKWMKDKNVFIVTGSDRAKTLEQIGHEIVDNCTLEYHCAVTVSYTHLTLPTRIFV